MIFLNKWRWQNICAGVNQRPKVYLYSGPTSMLIISLPAQPYHIIDFSFIFKHEFLNLYIYSSKIINLGYHSIFLPGSLEKPFRELVRLGPVPVLWFTPAQRLSHLIVCIFNTNRSKRHPIKKKSGIIRACLTPSLFFLKPTTPRFPQISALISFFVF